MTSTATLSLPARMQARYNARPVSQTTPRQVEQSGVHAPFIPTVEESNMIAALKEKDTDAMNRFVHDQSHRIYRVIFRLVRDPEEVRDLVQETFLQALRGIDSFRGQAKISTWLYRIAMNVTLGHLRKKIRCRQVLSEQNIDELQPRFTWRGTHTEQYSNWNPGLMIEKRERASILHEAIDQLPEPYRVVLTLRDLEELTTAEAAQVLTLSEVNIRVRLHRARNALRKILTPHFVDV